VKHRLWFCFAYEDREELFYECFIKGGESGVKVGFETLFGLSQSKPYNESNILCSKLKVKKAKKVERQIIFA
jgi:hypothetical protein